MYKINSWKGKVALWIITDLILMDIMTVIMKGCCNCDEEDIYTLVSVPVNLKNRFDKSKLRTLVLVCAIKV